MRAMILIQPALLDLIVRGAGFRTVRGLFKICHRTVLLTVLEQF